LLLDFSGADRALVYFVDFQEVADAVVLPETVLLLPAEHTDFQVFVALAVGELPPEGLVELDDEGVVDALEFMHELVDAQGT